MKLHFKSTRFPWQLWGRMASMLTKGGAIAFTDYQRGDVTRLVGVSFGMKRFIGLVVAGPFSQERVSQGCSCARPTDNLRRYAMVFDGEEGWTMLPDPDGEYVKFEDLTTNVASGGNHDA